MLLALIVFVSICAAIFSVLIYTSIDDNETSSKTPLAEYNNLFTTGAQDSLQIIATEKSANRLPISTYTYDKKYNVCVLKVILSNKLGLNKVINYQNENTKIHFGGIYQAAPSSNFEMQIRTAAGGLVTKVHFKYSGSLIKALLTKDSLYCYYVKFNTFAINYDDEPYDVIAKADQQNVPASIIFKEKEKFLYIVIMTVAEGNEEMPQDLLYNMVNK